MSEALVNMGIRELFTRGTGNNPELDNLFENEPLITADRLLHSAKVGPSKVIMILKIQFYYLLSERAGVDESYILHPAFEESLTRNDI